MSTVVYILIAALVFGVLIAVHELGHFMAAKACGVRVLSLIHISEPTRPY